MGSLLESNQSAVKDFNHMSNVEQTTAKYGRNCYKTIFSKMT